MDKFTFEAFMGEKWTAIKDFDGYFVSSYGRVWSNNQKARFLSFSIDKCGYFHVKLYKNKKPYSRLVHRLVAEAFVDNPNGYKEVNHLDEHKDNNRANNLEWCTRTHNILYGKAGKERYEKMKVTQRLTHSGQRAVECLDAKTGEVLHKFRSVGEAAREMFGVFGSKSTVRSNIISCCRHRKHVKTAHGYKWRYADV